MRSGAWSASSSEDEATAGRTSDKRKLRQHPSCSSVGDTPPPRRQLAAMASSPIPERRAYRKPKRGLRSGLAVVEGDIPIDPEDCPEPKQKRSAVLEERTQTPGAAFEEALQRLPAGFADDFFIGDGHTKLKPVLAQNAASPHPLEATITKDQAPTSERFPSWLRLMEVGFSLLVHGVGSKKQVLKDFAEQTIKPLGLVIVNINAFDARFSLCECFQALLEQIYPNAARQGTSTEALSTSVKAAAALPESRALCLVVHNIEHLKQQEITLLSTLAAAPKISLVASVDNIWAPLAWGSICMKNFNFVREEVNTGIGYDVEFKLRYPRGLPPWSGLGHDKRRTPKARWSVVLRSLTQNHRELVQAMAKRQLESDGQTGISMASLLKIANDLMIAHSVPKLRTLLNELRDHEVVVQRGNSSMLVTQELFYLKADESTLERLADGRALESEDEGEDDEANLGGNICEEQVPRLD